MYDLGHSIVTGIAAGLLPMTSAQLRDMRNEAYAQHRRERRKRGQGKFSQRARRGKR